MSYSICLYVKKVNSLEEGVGFANDFLQNLDFEKFVHSHQWHLIHEATNRDFKLCDWRSKDFRKNRVLLDFFIEKILNGLKFHFLYFKEQGLLAFIYNDCSTFKDQFDNWLCFQNSCDQDYSFDTWDGLSDDIDDIVNHWSSMSFEDYKKHLEDIGGEMSDYVFNEDGSVNEDHLQYELRSECYSDVETKLGITRYLYRRHDNEGYDFPWIKLDLYIPEDDCWFDVKNAVVKTIDAFKNEHPRWFEPEEAPKNETTSKQETENKS